MGLVLHPTAGFILDKADGAMPGPLPDADRQKLRALANAVREIAEEPKQAHKRDLWYRHNRLEQVRPMLLVFPEDSWDELLGDEQLELDDPFWRHWEWYLRHLIYRDQHLADDFVIEPMICVMRIVRTGGWGLEPSYRRPGRAQGAWRYDPPLADPEDIDKLRTPVPEVDEETAQRTYQALAEVLDDILPVEIHCMLPHANLIGTATALRGIEQVMWDMYDRPQWLHRLMSFITDGLMQQVHYLRENGYLTLNNGPHYVDAGGLGYTTELPHPDYDGYVRLTDLWGYGVAQELALVGPAQHEEFLLDYQVRLLERCGLNVYGCCESYDRKFDMLKRRIPRLRRVSVSPWCDVELAAEALQGEIIFSWKPNPAMLVGDFQREAVRAYIRRTLDVTRGCVLEVILKDTYTLEHDPARLESWIQVAREEIDRLCG